MAPERQPPTPPHLFQSFWIGGFEAACHVNDKGTRLDMIAATQHDRQVASDYALMKSLGMSTVRDAARWPLIESNRGFDFSSFAPMLAAAEEHGMQVMWTLCHYGWPDDVDLLGPDFPSRFARFAGAVARYVKAHSSRVPFYTPINEVSFLAWAAGDAGWFFPFARGRGVDVKRNLVRAVIAACDAIWAEDRRARIVHVDPVIHVMSPLTRPDLTEAAEQQRASQFEAWDMIAGIRDRELGGHPRYLDVMGVNFYHSNQWEFPDQRLRWEDTPRDARWVPLHRLLAEVYDRYRRPLFIAETSHFGVGRAAWIREVAAELWDAYGQGVPLQGLCLFPVIDRQDWNDPNHWHNSGLWDIVRRPDGTLHRVLNEEYGQEVLRSQALLARCGWGDLVHP
jgi:beta-glucosidase/6-phospho-beta-glucosidase/beta-galactosidase